VLEPRCFQIWDLYFVAVSKKISVCMIAYDEERFLAGALTSVLAIADEIIVGIDMKTRDRTREIAKSYKARTYDFAWPDDFAAARNTSLDHARKDWVLCIDPDERLTAWGAAMVRAVVRQPDPRVDGYCFESVACTLDGHREAPSPSTVRLWPNNPRTRYIGRCYEHPARNGKLLAGGVLRGGVGLLHYGGDPQLYASRNKGSRNLELLYQQHKNQPDDRLTVYLIAHQHQINGNASEAREFARRALDMPGDLSSAALQELENAAYG